MALSPDAMKVMKGMLRDHEGFRPFPYDDATGKTIVKGYTLVGNITWGIGYNISVNPCLESDEYLRIEKLITQFDKDLTNKLPYYAKLDENRKIVLLDMAYQMGLNGLMGFKQMHAAAAKNDWVTSSLAMMESDWARNPKFNSRVTKLNKLWELGGSNGF